MALSRWKNEKPTSATATLATFATVDHQQASYPQAKSPSVARVATVAVADRENEKVLDDGQIPARGMASVEKSASASVTSANHETFVVHSPLVDRPVVAQPEPVKSEVSSNLSAPAFDQSRYQHLVTCQNCAHLSANGRCKVKADYKPMPDAKRDCSRHQITPETRQPVADAPYTPDELNALMRRQEDQLLNHLVHCPDCRVSDRRWCADGFAVGSAYDALLLCFDDADDRHHAFVSRVIRKRLEGCK